LAYREASARYSMKSAANPFPSFILANDLFVLGKQ